MYVRFWALAFNDQAINYKTDLMNCTCPDWTAYLQANLNTQPVLYYESILSRSVYLVTLLEAFVQ